MKPTGVVWPFTFRIATSSSGPTDAISCRAFALLDDASDFWIEAIALVWNGNLSRTASALFS